MFPMRNTAKPGLQGMVRTGVWTVGDLGQVQLTVGLLDLSMVTVPGRWPNLNNMGWVEMLTTVVVMEEVKSRQPLSPIPSLSAKYTPHFTAWRPVL